MMYLLLALALAAPTGDAALRKRVDRVLDRTPLIDGHNDVPWAYRSRAQRRIDGLPFDQDTQSIERPMHTDLPRLRKGQVGGVFWSTWIPTSLETAPLGHGVTTAERVALAVLELRLG